MSNLEIASEKLRQIVAELQKTGLPPVFTDASELNAEQVKAYEALAQASEDFAQTVDMKANERGELPKPGSRWWNGCLAFRKALQAAIEADLLRAAMVQQYMFDFGAVPDPEYQWKWCYDFDQGAYCWECGSKILSRPTLVSHVHSRKGEFIGTIGGGQEGYCPTCDAKAA